MVEEDEEDEAVEEDEEEQEVTIASAGRVVPFVCLTNVDYLVCSFFLVVSCFNFSQQLQRMSRELGTYCTVT